MRQDAEVRMVHGAQDAGVQLQRIPGTAVGAQRDFVGGAAAEVSPGRVVQALACIPLMIGQRDGVFGEGLALQRGGGNIGQNGLQGNTIKRWQLLFLNQASAHMRSRLW